MACVETFFFCAVFVFVTIIVFKFVRDVKFWFVVGSVLTCETDMWIFGNIGWHVTDLVAFQPATVSSFLLQSRFCLSKIRIFAVEQRNAVPKKKYCDQGHCACCVWQRFSVKKQREEEADSLRVTLCKMQQKSWWWRRVQTGEEGRAQQVRLPHHSPSIDELNSTAVIIRNIIYKRGGGRFDKEEVALQLCTNCHAVGLSEFLKGAQSVRKTVVAFADSRSNEKKGKKKVRTGAGDIVCTSDVFTRHVTQFPFVCSNFALSLKCQREEKNGIISFLNNLSLTFKTWHSKMHFHFLNK